MTLTFNRSWRSQSARNAAILKRWPALTLEDIEIASSDRGMLAVCIVERYGLQWERARSEIEDWEARAI